MTLHDEQGAIKQAVEAGWMPKDWNFASIMFDGLSNDGSMAMFSNEKGDDGIWQEYAIEVIFSDPDLWQSLGKKMGWVTDEYSVSFGNDHPRLAHRYGGIAYTQGTWQYHSRRYFETLLSGGDMKPFWESLP